MLIGVSAVASSSSIKSVLARIDVDGIYRVLSDEAIAKRGAATSRLPQIGSQEDRPKSTVKRIQVNPEPKSRKETNGGMKLMGQLF